MNRQMTRTIVAAGLVALAASASGAQQPTAAPRWQAWLGCWTAVTSVDAYLPMASGPLVCVTPTNGADVVEIATIAGGKVVSTQRIDASGREEPVDAKGCTGTQRATWSADGRRVFLHSVATCDGVRRTTSGILAMTPSGEWLDVQGIAADRGENVRVARYRDAGVPTTVPASISAALSGRTLSVQGARIAAGAPIGRSAVIEATHEATAPVTEAFVLERGQKFTLDARELVALADAGVPASVTDAMVAVSNPERFAVAHAGELPPNTIRTPDDVVTGQRIPVYMEPAYGWGYASPFGYPYGALGYGYSGYGYPGYYSGYGYPGYFYGAPVIVLNGQSGSTQHAKLVKGRGYTPSTPSTPSTTPRGTTSSGASSPSPSASSGSGQSSAPAPSSAPRTAKPRP